MSQKAIREFSGKRLLKEWFGANYGGLGAFPGTLEEKPF